MSSSTAGALRRARRDPWLLSAVGVWIALFVLLLVLPEDSRLAASLALRVAPLLFLCLAIGSVLSTPSRGSSESRFWALVVGALSCWLAARLLYALVPSPRSLTVHVAADVLYTGFFLGLILALEVRPGGRGSGTPSVALLGRGFSTWPAAVLFVLGLLSYFAVVPAVLYRNDYAQSSGIMMLYVALDSYLVVRTGICFVGAGGGRWRLIYAGFWVACVGLLVGDALEAAILGGILGWPFSWASELLWVLPILALIGTARLAASWPATRRTRVAVSAALGRVFPREHLVAFALILPALHLAGYQVGFFDERSRDARSWLVLGWLFALGSLAVGQFRRVARQGQRLAETMLRQTAELARKEERVVHLTKRQEVEAALRESEEMFSKAFWTSPDALLISSLPDGNLIDVNLGFEEVTGWRRDEALGRSTTDLEIWSHPEDRIQFFDRIRDEGRVRGFECEISTRTGDRRLVQISAEPMEVAGAPSLLTVVRDLTDSRRMEQQALRAQRMDSIGTLAGGLAHDLNNLLTPIVMSIQLLHREGPVPDRRRLLETLQSNAERASGVIGQVLTLARGIEGRRVLVDVAQVGREVASIVRETFPRTLVVDFDIEEDRLGRVRGDPTQIHQVLLNLCLNARDAVAVDGRIQVSILSRVLEEDESGPDGLGAGNYVVLTVADDGEGIRPEVADRILEPFFTTKPGGMGTGLGLSTALAIVESHGGRLRWRSTPGEGARFAVWLPVATGMSSDRLPTVKGVEPDGHGELVLVIDDEPSIGEVVRRVLGDRGYRVEVATDGVDGLARYREHRSEVRVVLLDMMMPLLDGPSTLEVFRRLDPTLPIIGTSGLASEKAQLVSRELDGFLAKPFTAVELLGTLAALLHRESTGPRSTAPAPAEDAS